MKVKPNLVIIDIDGTVSPASSTASPERESGWTDDIVAPSRQSQIHHELIDRLAQLDNRGDTEVVWLSWWPREKIEQLNRELGVGFRILSLENRPRPGKRHALRIELLRANRERVVWLDDEEATTDATLDPLAYLLTLQPDFFVGLTPLYMETVNAYLDGSDEAQLIEALVNAEAWRWSERVRPRHGYSRRAKAPFDNRGTLMREAFLSELASIAQHGHVRPNADESYGTRDGVRLEPWQFEHAVQLWAEHGLAIEFHPLSDKPGEIRVAVPQLEGLDDGA